MTLYQVWFLLQYYDIVITRISSRLCKRDDYHLRSTFLFFFLKIVFCILVPFLHVLTVSIRTSCQYVDSR